MRGFSSLLFQVSEKQGESFISIHAEKIARWVEAFLLFQLFKQVGISGADESRVGMAQGCEHMMKTVGLAMLWMTYSLQLDELLDETVERCLLQRITYRDIDAFHLFRK